MTNDEVLAEFRAAGALLAALASIEVPTYPADGLPPDLAAVPAVKPGSRGLK